MKLIQKGFLKRNRKIIIISILIMLISAVAGCAISSMYGDEAHKGKVTEGLFNVAQNKTGNVSGTEDISVNPLELFVHNLTADLIAIVLGLVFSIFSVLLTVFNGFSIGSIFGMDLTFACVSVLPHAIIEYLAGALALAAAFIITKLEIKAIKNRDIRGTLDESKVELNDLLTLIIIIVVLLAVAAVIEGWITPIIVKSFFGLKKIVNMWIS